MSFDKEIGAPYTVASLPKPIDSVNGRTQASGVCSISGAKKRKRTEIAVGVDGEGILIYSLQNPQLVTSYALPPQTSFAAAPYCLYRKGATRTPSRRFTYACIAPSSPSDKPQLVCFTEVIQKDATADTVKTTYTVSNSTSNVIAIDAIPVSTGSSSKETEHDVLVVFDNGDSICLSSDLEVVRWVANVESCAPKRGSPILIEHVSLSTAKAVIHGLLRSREDIVTILDPSSDTKPELLDLTQVLSVVSRHTDGNRSLGLFQLQSRSSDISSIRLPLKHLLTWDLPSPSSLATSKIGKRNYSLHPTTGNLHELTEEGLISYNFSGTVPKIYSELAVPGPRVDSFLRISQDLIFASSQHLCRILDVKYKSIQGLLSLDSTPSTSTETKKRKQPEPDSFDVSTATPTLVAHYAELGLVVGIQNQELVGLQLRENIARKRVKTEGRLLIDSLGKGIPAEGELSGASLEKWQEKVVKLDKYVSKGKITKFEEVFAAELGVSFVKDEGDEEKSQAELETGHDAPKLQNGTTGKNVHQNGVNTDDNSSEDQLRKWQMPEVIPDHKRYRHRHQTSYALRKIFRCVKASTALEGNLKIDFFPPNVFQWLLHSGSLTKESIRRALIEESPENLGSSITDGDVVKAIVDFDPELHILSAVLNHTQFLPVGEVVQAVKLLLQSLDDGTKADSTTKLLTNGEQNHGEEMDVDIASELEAASHEIDHALSVLDNGLLIRSHALRPALIRLHTFPVSTISSSLRVLLSRRELESLIRLLHLELKNGGWTSSYDFGDAEAAPAQTPTEDPDDHAVAIIASLLSCALDAVGAGAWLAAVGDATSDDAASDIIQQLHQDTSEALNGFWEARFMRGLLSEFLRYSSSLSKTQKPSNKSLQNQSKPFKVESPEEELPVLPLGGKADLGVDKKKAGKGGKKEERSAREMGMLISKRVPKYSFERIVL
ncbi:hypothetical protein BS50DRAFT_635441 [Corynespora cassiicola Philippines]|uniref:Utp8 beta-propeller domain-containing protein n=1 Tax=Corynespora cassiicola Philippines TaxID=1448308 RepID=A0A2T2NLI3_CORCC|nr:hypothetical protein BS50DRAFT_635441 [Corynespora cassiicola Philippines]